MLKLIGEDSVVALDEVNDDIIVNYELGYDSEVHYPLTSTESIKGIKQILQDKTALQIQTNLMNIELLIGLINIGAPEVFISLLDNNAEFVDYDPKTAQKELLTLTISKKDKYYKELQSILEIIKLDMNYSRKGESYEHKSNTSKY